MIQIEYYKKRTFPSFVSEMSFKRVKIPATMGAEADVPSIVRSEPAIKQNK